MRILRSVLIVLALVGVALSLVTIDLHVKLRVDPSLMPSFCHLSETVNCLPVLASRWASIFGIPLGSYGVVFYLTFAMLVLIEGGAFKKQLAVSSSLLLFLALLSSIASVALFLVSKFQVKAVCPVCLAMYAVNFSLLFGSWRLDRKTPFSDRVWIGFTDLLSWPSAVLGIGKGAGTSSSGAVRGLFVAFVAVALSSIYLPGVRAKMLMDSPEVQANVERELNEIVVKWQSAKVDQIPENTAPGLNIDYTKGSPTAPIKLIEFSDYECPACRHFYNELHEVLEEFGDKVYFEHRNFPIDRSCNPLIDHEAHHNACHAAFFARCAGEQGKFWEATDYLFRLSAFDLDEPAGTVRSEIDRGVEVLSLDSIGMQDCMKTGRHRAKIVDDINIAEKLGLEATPSIWINGKKLEGQNGEILRRIFKKILAS